MKKSEAEVFHSFFYRVFFSKILVFFFQPFKTLSPGQPWRPESNMATWVQHGEPDARYFNMGLSRRRHVRVRSPAWPRLPFSTPGRDVRPPVAMFDSGRNDRLEAPWSSHNRHVGLGCYVDSWLPDCAEGHRSFSCHNFAFLTRCHVGCLPPGANFKALQRP